MELILKLSPDVAAALRTGRTNNAAIEADAVLRPLQLQMHPLHPRRVSGPLSTYFAVEAPDQLVDMLRARLQRIKGVEAAYTAPAPGLPQVS